MNFFKKIFGVAKESKEPTEEEKKAEEKKNFDILKYDGVKALKVNQTAYAVECFVHALELKDDSEIRDYLSQAYMALGELSKAYDQLQKLSESHPDNIEIFIRMAHVAYMMEDYTVMSVACEKALMIDKDSVRALYLYAKACVGTDDISNAVAMLSKAIILDPDYADAYLLRGEVLLGDGKLDEADEDAAFLLDKYPDNEDILMLKAKIESARGKFAEAIGLFCKVIEANPFNAEAYRLRGELRQQTGDETSAKADFDYAAELAAADSEHGEGVEEKVKEAYNNVNPLGL